MADVTQRTGVTSEGARVSGTHDVDDPHYRRTSVCPNCHRRLETRRCKALCVRCGYFDSCADLL